ncbi:Serine/threonine-protein kinase CBK1 [Hordeum vulgare]|nr:Serine/threonine-protein kinase CBK1 [Hordeum vulgare]
MLLIMAIDPLFHLIRVAVDRGVLLPVRAHAVRCQMSLYVNEARIFINPNKDELSAINSILVCFGNASGLITNILKTEIFPIHYDDIDMHDLLTVFLAKISSFPGKYLGLPLDIRWLRKVHLQPLIDKVHGRLPGLKGKNIARVGRVALAKSWLTSIATFHTTAIPLPK